MPRNPDSPRRRLALCLDTGRLRDALKYRNIDPDVVDLVVDICYRYTAPRRTRRAVSRAITEAYAPTGPSHVA